MDDQNNITPINPAPSQVPGAPLSPAGATASNAPASPVPGQPQEPISREAVVTDPSELAGIKSMLVAIGEAGSMLDKRIADLERRNALSADLDAEQSGDLAAQVHALTSWVKGMAQKYGYVHREPVRGPNGR